jgi:ABC-type tungstate transport system substrate-binding protein
MKAFSPAQIKADIVFLLSIVATFGFNLTNVQTAALLGASALIAAVVNFAEAHIHVGAAITSAVDRAVTEVKSLTPAINVLLASLPGKIAAEVKAAVELAEKGPAAGGSEATK